MIRGDWFFLPRRIEFEKRKCFTKMGIYDKKLSMGCMLHHSKKVTNGRMVCPSGLGQVLNDSSDYVGGPQVTPHCCPVAYSIRCLKASSNPRLSDKSPFWVCMISPGTPGCTLPCAQWQQGYDRAPCNPEKGKGVEDGWALLALYQAKLF